MPPPATATRDPPFSCKTRDAWCTNSNSSSRTGAVAVNSSDPRCLCPLRMLLSYECMTLTRVTRCFKNGTSHLSIALLTKTPCLGCVLPDALSALPSSHENAQASPSTNPNPNTVSNHPPSTGPVSPTVDKRTSLPRVGVATTGCPYARVSSPASAGRTHWNCKPTRSSGSPSPISKKRVSPASLGRAVKGTVAPGRGAAGETHSTKCEKEDPWAFRPATRAVPNAHCAWKCWIARFIRKETLKLFWRSSATTSPPSGGPVTTPVSSDAFQTRWTEFCASVKPVSRPVGEPTREKVTVGDSKRNDPPCSVRETRIALP
mmetsp:Transcript_319/g.1214  ORF Transcript_319/g.1214 Transcript_319/m.1214 type:complete len:318 (-) Transcript_319:82-1035(-)